MALSLAQRVDLMVRLGKYIEEIPDDLAKAMEEAHLQNNWFTSHFIAYALEKIRTQYLSEDKLQQWIDCYPGLVATSASAKKVGMVMAGNIPLAGFHDFLCGFISGQRLLMKLSSKDAVLLKHFLSVLAAWEPLTAEILQTADLLKGCDAYIATGSDNSARYFEYYFAAYPHIIRRNRTSIALLDGSETTEELEKLADDICLYFGWGCRNVTQVCVPAGYDFQPLLSALDRYAYFMEHHRYKNNYDYNLTLHLLNQQPYLSSAAMLLSENEVPYSPVSVLHYRYYTDLAALADACLQDQRIQCIVGRNFVPFGTAQSPSLSDYADGVDTLQFLAAL